MTPNARFWTWINGGPVKLTLRPDQSLQHYTAQSTDEGWSSEANHWSHEGNGIKHTWHTDGRDCDGRLQQFGEGRAHLCKLQVNPAWPPDDPNMQGVSWPEWEDVETSQRDEYAEMAGY